MPSASTPANSHLQNAFRALRNRNYSLFFAGQGLSLIGTWIQQTGEVWLAYRLTHSAFYLGLVGFASQIPTFVFSPMVGAVVDRTDRRKLLIWAQVLAMIQAFVLAALVITHLITYTQLIVLSLISGSIDALDIPARQSFVVLMVERREELSNAIALNSSLVNVARLVGPSVAGLLIAAVGEGWCFFINGISYVFVIAALLMMKIASPSRGGRPKEAWTQSVMDGMKYAAHSRPIATLLTLLATISLSGSAYAVLMPIFAGSILHGGAHTLGFLMTGSGVGALAAALYLAQRPSVLGLGRLITVTMPMFGAAIVLFSFSKVFVFSWIAALFIGFGMMASTASINTVIQTIVDEDKRGRVMSLFTMAFIGMSPFGQVMGGEIAQHLGAPWAARIAGLCVLVGAVIYRSRYPALREHIRAAYQHVGILPEVAQGLQTSTTAPLPPG